MADTPTNPGVYVQENVTGTRAIVGVGTSTALFVGVSREGPIDVPVKCNSLDDFVTVFSQDSAVSDLARYVALFFANGGTTVHVVRVADGAAGDAPQPDEYRSAYLAVDRAVDSFNLMVLPPAAGVDRAAMWGEASEYCRRRSALLLMDGLPSIDVDAATRGADDLRNGVVKDFAAMYHPGLTVIEHGAPVTVGPSGAIAGLMARIDGERGVWKAPAGIDGDIRGVVGLARGFTSAEHRLLHEHGVNTVSELRGAVVCWGARTMEGTDGTPSDFEYVPVRRLALFLESSLSRGLQWTVFEPNGEPLWAQIRLTVDNFMFDLFRKGAFQGTTTDAAYFVRCDATTMTQDDIEKGIVVVVVGFAPLKPAEFVVFRLRFAVAVAR
jgi:phage tail sheath protein FI